MISRKGQRELPTTDEVNAFLGKGTTLEGKISFEGVFRLDGNFKGVILAGDSLIIGETGEVNGQINVKSLIVNGQVKGNVKAENRIEISRSGEIRGDIQTALLVLSEGAILEGNCQMPRGETQRDGNVSVLKPKEDAREETEIIE
ncbi:MAG: polymer-forming cytoskeletal protein [Proteobacteria bacterium]|nr:polymer-forming cytoskeletal protein [Pseudomonadota bacterium]